MDIEEVERRVNLLIGKAIERAGQLSHSGTVVQIELSPADLLSAIVALNTAIEHYEQSPYRHRIFELQRQMLIALKSVDHLLAGRLNGYERWNAKLRSMKGDDDV